ncbi:MAG: hypothetical protein LBI35_01165 [Burkholderiales bacterium]|nr:hypothetical protein [Burkholderiales bacterium]
MKTEKYRWCWLYNGTPDINTFETAEAAMDDMRHKFASGETMESLAPRIQLARVKVTVEPVMVLRGADFPPNPSPPKPSP